MSIVNSNSHKATRMISTSQNLNDIISLIYSPGVKSIFEQIDWYCIYNFVRKVVPVNKYSITQVIFSASCWKYFSIQLVPMSSKLIVKCKTILKLKYFLIYSFTMNTRERFRQNFSWRKKKNFPTLNNSLLFSWS